MVRSLSILALLAITGCPNGDPPIADDIFAADPADPERITLRLGKGANVRQ